MADNDDEFLSVEEREKAEQELLAACEKFVESEEKTSDSEFNTDATEQDDFEPAVKKRKAKKRVAKKDQVFDVKVAVCNEVRKHPEIYQITCKGYQDKNLKDASWKEISISVSEIIGIATSADTCKKHWTALKESTR